MLLVVLVTIVVIIGAICFFINIFIYFITFVVR